MAGCYNDVNDHVIGTKGSAQLMAHHIDGPEKWQYAGPDHDMYQVEHDELFASIRAGKPIDNTAYMARSTMMAIMGRMATYTGQQIKWDQALASQEDLSPPKYEFGKTPFPAVAEPDD